MNVIEDHRRQITELRAKTRGISESLNNPMAHAMAGAAGGAGMGTDAAAEAHKWAELKRSMSKGAAVRIT